MLRRLWPLVLSLPVLLLIPGCLTSNAPGPDEIVLVTNAPANQVETWKTVAEAFAEESKLTVAVQHLPGDGYSEKLSRMLQGRQKPDVVLIDSRYLPQFVAQGVLEDLTPYLKQTETIDPDDYYPAAWQMWQAQGALYGLPHSLDLLALAFNEDLAELAYAKIPRDGLTWDAFVTAAKDMTRDENGDGRPETWGASLSDDWQVFVWQNGGDVVDDPANPRRSTMATPEAQEALQFVADLHLKHRCIPRIVHGQDQERLQSFVARRSGMTFVTRTDAPRLNRSDLRWMTASIPRHKQAANFAAGQGFCLVKGGRHTAEGWKLIEYLASEAGQKGLLNGGAHVPTREAIVNSEHFGGGFGGSNNWPFALAIKVMHPLPVTPQYHEIEQIWGEELARLWSGEAPLAEVCQRIDERVNKVLSAPAANTAWLLPIELQP